ncbi:G-type lectin S-receptor-like serine threonine-kinase LECRK3 [Olea europaea subsp. europaea]|uniref:Receptor-like serine/threonine-protein kinase n=1 Tax=Olea europaea subsp. europaea TaxID=158383 RepID=A0A8S0QVG3_OLEEU|nr:G-type lectin S-receptor-like serine threonine-kinase LECRK3 [Olea europaea subsp. europaea]
MAFAVSITMFFVLLVLLPVSPTAQPYRNVTSGSSLTANNENSTWLSPSEEFAFGFQQIIRGGYLMAIWFNEIPERTIVWSANRDNLVQEGSKVQLSADGRFELSDPRGQKIWYRAGVAYGAMLDTGNFVLANTNSDVLWQSFDEPTDTLLPTQSLNIDGKLVSSFSKSNFSRGRFIFTLQDGNLVSYARNLAIDKANFSYWSTKTVDSGFKVIFNQSGNVFLEGRNGSVLNLLSPRATSTSQFYQRAILEYDGVLRLYVHPKSANSSGGRAVGWSTMDFIPQNICGILSQNSGGVTCGFNSLCSLGTDQIAKCECPFGYSFIDPSDSRSDCRPNFTPESCNGEGRETDLFSIIDKPNADWPYSDYAAFGQVSEDWCRQVCLDDCYCTAARYEKGNCYKKRFPLANGKIDANAGGKVFIKIRNSNATADSSPSKKSKRSILITTRSVFLGSSMLLNFLLLLSIFLCAFSFSKRKSKGLQSYQLLPAGLNIRIFSFKELQEATNGFVEELGRGAYSTVYKGTIKNDNTETVVAVKKLHKMATEGEEEFKTEVSSIRRTSHKNLVQLLGYCDEDQNQLLVYEFMSNGSLANFLFENSRPNCKNIGLRISQLLKADQSRTTTGIRGTKGYVAPEWFRNMPITVKVDVYSFGILLLELICCRHKFEPKAESESEKILADFAYDCYKEGTIHLLGANDEEALNDERFDKFVMIAIWCIQEDPTLRPTMKRVLQLMEGSVEVPGPPDPASSTTSI